MRNAPQHLANVWKPLDAGARPQVWLEVVDRGADFGMDIRIYHPITGKLCFEIITLDPDHCPLIGKAPQLDAAFGAFCKALSRAESMNRICILIQFQHCHSKAYVTAQENYDRNSRIYRMVEDIADEILTHRPGSLVEIARRNAGQKSTSLM